MIRFVNADRDFRSGTPRMTVERSANHVPIGFIISKSIRAGMKRHKAMPFLLQPDVQKVVHVVRMNWQGTRRVEHDNVIILQVLFC